MRYGMGDRRITSPTLLIDERKCRENIRMMVEKARVSGVVFRPHFKTHQSAVIGEWFREEGVNAITVSSVEMAGYFAQAGWTDITIAFPVNLREADEISGLADTIKLNIIVNAAETLRSLQTKIRQPLGIIIEIDCGYHRSGLTPDDLDEINMIIHECHEGGNAEFKGFLSHFGNTYSARSTEEIRQIFHEGTGKLISLRDNLGLGDQAIISVGDTPSCSILDTFQEVDEIRPGNFIFYDVMQMGLGSCHAGQVAVCVAAPVVDLYHSRNEAVIHGGAVHLSKEHIRYDGDDVYGLVVRLTDDGWSDPLPGCRVKSLSQEHGILHCDPQIMKTLQRGSLVGILPVHSCLTVDAMKTRPTLILRSEK